MNTLFEHPWLLLGLFPLVFVGITLQRTQKKIVESMALWVPQGLLNPLSLSWFIRQNLCLLSGMLFLVIAAAGPFLSNHKAYGLEKRHGLVVIAFKANEKSSQASINLQSRLLSQLQREQLRREGGRIGLMPYGGGSEIFCPLTLDPEFYEYVGSSLKRVSLESAKPDTLDRAGSLKEALKNALETLQNQTLSSQQIVLVLFENLGGEEAIKDALIHANIPAEIGLTLVFPEASKVPEILGVYCTRKNAEAVALGSQVIPDDRVFEVLKTNDLSNRFFQTDGVVTVAAPAWFALPGLLCLLMAFMFPANICSLAPLINQGRDR